MQKLVCPHLWIQLAVGVQADSLPGWRTWVTGGHGLLSRFLSSQEVAMVEGMGPLVLKQNQQQFIDPFLCMGKSAGSFLSSYLPSH